MLCPFVSHSGFPNRTFLAVAAGAFWISLGMCVEAAEQGQMGELSFISTNSASNRFDVTLQATFQQGSESYTLWGFYAGGDTWKVRYNLPSPGAWTYSTHSSDSQLDDKKGTLHIGTAGPSNRGQLIQNGRALTWENTRDPFFIMGQTAYSLAHQNIPWHSVLEWLESNGFNLVRMDLVSTGFTDPDGMADTWLWAGTPGNPDFSQFNLAQWNKIDAILSDGLTRGLVFELGPKITHHLPLPGPNRTKYLRYLAARIGAYPHIVFLEDFEIFGPVRGETIPNQDTIKSVGDDLSGVFQGYPHHALFGIHTRRNDTYYEGSVENRFVDRLLKVFGMAADRTILFFDLMYYHPGSPGLPADFRGQNWLTVGIFHERWKMEGFGILQHRPHFNMPMYVGEAVYEKTDNTVIHSVTRELDYAGMRDEIVSNPKFYYRRYVASVILSGGIGITYGLQGHSIHRDNHNTVLERYLTGYPPSQDGRNGAEGYKDVKKVLDYFRAKRLDVNRLDPDDTRINNGFSQKSSNVLSRRIGLKRAKFASIKERHEYYAYNPYHSDVTIIGIPPGLPIEIVDPKTGSIYSAGQTNGSTLFTKPSQFAGDYLLHIGQSDI